jgi:hypothetical protein
MNSKPYLNELNRQLTIAKKVLTRLNIKMNKVTDNNVWMSYANQHSKITLAMSKVRKAIKEIQCSGS